MTLRVRWSAAKVIVGRAFCGLAACTSGAFAAG